MKNFDQLNRRDLITVAISTLLGGGVLGAIINQLFTREKTLAEVRKIEAETEKSKAETAKLRSETTPIASPPSAKSSSNRPKGWFLAGSNPEDYDWGIDQNEMLRGKGSCYLKSRKSPRGFGTVMQMFKANSFLGKRLKLTGSAKSEGVEDWAGLWMRVDGPANKVVSFDNMSDRPIRGTTGWTKYQVVLDVPDDSVNIAFGLLLKGTGQVWMADNYLEIVSLNVPATDTVNRVTAYPEKPINLGFDD